jgi:hypothetical protein
MVLRRWLADSGDGRRRRRLPHRHAAHRADEAEPLLAPDITFRSPVVHRPYEGRDQVMPILHAVACALEDFRYGTTYTADDGGTVLAFSGRVGGLDLEGIDLLSFDDAGGIDGLTVYIRPLSALTALREAMVAQLAPPAPGTS